MKEVINAARIFVSIGRPLKAFRRFSSSVTLPTNMIHSHPDPKKGTFLFLAMSYLCSRQSFLDQSRHFLSPSPPSLPPPLPLSLTQACDTYTLLAPCSLRASWCRVLSSLRLFRKSARSVRSLPSLNSDHILYLSP